MQTDPQIAEIARKLTAARKRLLLALPENRGWGRAPVRQVAVRLWYSLTFPRPLIEHKHCPKDHAEWRLSATGQSVAAYLKEQSNG